MSVPTQPMWFVADDGKGFTSQIEHAATDLAGVPVIAPGATRRLLEHQKAVHETLLEQLWEKCLDQMELYYVTRADHKSVPDDSAIREEFIGHRSELNGLFTALAVMEYGHLYQTEPQEAVRRIKATAKVKYDISSEG